MRRREGGLGEVAMATITYAFAPIVGETTLNQNTTGVQSLPATADLAGGGYISVWDNQDNISGRIFENSGAARTAEFTINTTLPGIQRDPEVVGLVGGRAVAVWTDFGGVEPEVRAQMINSDGTLFGPEIIISEQAGPLTTAGFQTTPDVAALSDGGWVVTWQDNDPVGNDVLAQIYNADGSFRSVAGGSDPGRIVIGGADNDILPTVAPTTGGFAVIYTEVVGANDQVRFQRYDLAGAPLGVEVLADSTGTTNRELDATGLANGGFAFVYTDNGQSAGAETDISLQVWTSAGLLTSLATANVNIPGFNAGLDGGQTEPTIDVMSNGFLTVSWTNENGAGDADDTVDRAVWDPNNTVGGVFTAFIANPAGALLLTEDQSAIAGLPLGRIALLGRDTSALDVTGLLEELVRTTTGDGTSEILTGDSLRDIM